MNHAIDTNAVYVLNPEYDLKVDKKRVIIITSKDADISSKEVNGFVHPVYAMLLSLFDGKKKLKQVIDAIDTGGSVGRKSCMLMAQRTGIFLIQNVI